MWPMLLDMSKEECKRVLRRIELEAYCAVVSAFRAQGDLTKEKKKILQELQSTLSISTERHRAEVRRAVNDEKFATIADNICGPSTDAEWMIEGRRLIPLMPRLVPQTAFTVTANQMANLQAEKNAAMPSPSRTGSKDLNTSLSSPPTPVSGTVTKVTRPSSPNSNVVVLPSGMSIHIKGGLNTEEEEELPARKRRRSQSSESLNMVSPSAGTQTPRVTYTTAPGTMTTMSPVKITISKSPQTRPQITTSTSQSQKVILVSSSGQASSSSILQQKSITVPVVKTTSSIGGSANQKASIILPNSANGNLGNIVTVATPSMSSTTSSGATPTQVTTSTMTFLTPTVSIQKPRPKTIPRQRFPLSQGQQKPGVVIPMGPQPVQPSPQNMQNIQIKPVSKSTSTIQIRQEGGMKIITQSFPGSTGSKILPKPTQLSSSSGTPVVVVSAGSTHTTSSGVTMVTRPITSIGQAGTKILNITTQGGKVISTGTSRSPNVVTVNPKTLHLTAVKGGAGGSGKPNVIVVQKTQPRKLSTSTQGSRGTTIISSPFEKELLSFLQKQDSTKHIVVTTPSGGHRPVERKVIVTTPGQLEASRQRVRIENAEGKSSSTLIQDLIQAASQDHEGGGDVTINLDEATLAALTGGTSSHAAENVATKGSTNQTLPNNEWFEYDVADENNQSYQTSIDQAAVQALIDQTPGKPKVTVQRSASVDISQLSDQLSQQQFYTIEQAMKILNQPEQSETVVSENVLVEEGQETGSEGNVVIETVNNTQNPDIATQNELEQIARNLNLQGELDPQTGIFYTVTNAAGQTETRRLTADSRVVTETRLAADPRVITETTQGEVSANSKTYDLLSSSLAQAQIDLDPYQFIEEDVLAEKVSSTADSQVDSNIIEIPTSEDVVSDSAVETVSSSDHSNDSASTERPVGTTIRIKPNGSSFIPIQDMVKSASTINVTQEQLMPDETNIVIPAEGSEFTTETVEVTGTSDFLTQPTTLGEEVQIVMDAAALEGGHLQTADAVTIETTQTVDPSEVSLDEFVVMDNPAPGTSSSDNHIVDPLSSSDPTGLAKLGKRKRKLPSAVEDSPTLPGGGWTRACLGLIQKVMKYRGLNRHKDDLNASTWFLEPVDQADAPDYYTIIKNPMDFGTIKRKLESCSYNDYEDFHSDMLLVRDNCRLYNPPGSIVRRDCDEVFAYYMSEYERILEKWQKAHISSPSSKKLKFESKSPKI